MAESIVVSTAQWIGSLLIQEARPLFNVEKQVQGLHDELEHMQQYLQDADARQEESEINASVRQVRKLVYDAEDVIDTYILKVKRHHESKLAKSAYFLYKFPHIYQVREEIQGIQTSLKRVADQLNSYGVRRDKELGVHLRSQRPPSLPYDDIDGDLVVGLEKDIPKLLEVLTGEGKTQENILSIVGMGGSGKTTLARKLYNHPYVRDCFDCTAWVSVSQEWSTCHILSAILRETGFSEANPTNMASISVSEHELMDKLRTALTKKSYLVVLDDVWKREALEEILPALPRTQYHKGSKIIITTRNRHIIQFQNLLGSMCIHESKPLSDEEGWKLFSKIALNRGRHNIGSFVTLGKDMLKTCDGLPLAIVALAGILNTKDNIAEWQHVSDAVRSRVMDGTGTHMYGRVGDMLALSYNDLPYSLKPCFLYLGLFPEDSHISAGILTRMWIAEGLISAPWEMSLEDVAIQFLEELSHRFMIQVVRTDSKGVIKAITLHDLFRDFCLKKANDLSFLQIYTPVSDTGSSNFPAFAVQPRRAALHSSTSLPSHISNLRSLVLLTRSSIPESPHDSQESLNLIKVLKSYKLLRLLSLRGIRTVNGRLPTQIGVLIHLRYLEIRATNIVELPMSIENLKYLMVLDYRDIRSRESLPIMIPNVLWKLVQLRHLFLPSECPWSVKKLRLGTLLRLQTLWGVKQDSKGEWLSEEVSQLSSTIKKLKIVASSEKELKASFRNPSLMSDGLQTFHCELKSGIALRNVEPLSLRGRLHKLILIGEVDMKLLLVLPTNVVTLELKNCVVKDEDPMAALGGLAHLKLLTLVNAFVTTELTCQPGSFPRLDELYMESLQNVQTWKIETGAMPRLRKLEIIRCWCLQEFPRDLKVVTTLQQLEFFEMPGSFAKKAIQYGWSTQKLRLPYNYGAIIKRSVFPVDSSTLRKLHEQLTVGIFLDNKSKKYWIAPQHGSYCNCFMVYASDLIIPRVMLRGAAVTYKKEVYSEDGIEGLSVLRLTGNQYSDVEVMAEFNTADLSEGLTYEIQWVIKFEYCGLLVDEVEAMIDFTCFHTKVGLKGENHVYQTRRVEGMLKNYWIRIDGGEFQTYSTKSKELECGLVLEDNNDRCALLIKGFIIQPKP